MFYGSDRAYTEIIPKSYRNLSDIAMQMDDENKQIPLVLVGLPEKEETPKKTKKKKISNHFYMIHKCDELLLCC